MKINKCVRCMQELETGDIFCTDCGYDQRQGNSDRALPIGTVLNDKYTIGAVIGEGGFGITYAAWDMLIETRIAIKEYFPSELVTRDTTLQEENAVHNLVLIQEKAGESRYREGLERFVKEAGNLAKFQKHPGIVSVKDFFYENNTAYMVMEYIDGVTLNSYLKSRNGKLGKGETFRMMKPVMKTLEAIHKEGVIHRDISPDNIMVTVEGQMKLIDFGAARFVGADDEKSLTVILKHGYAPEEQYRSNGEQGPWTDVYAVCAVIYRMLTGKVPEETLKRMTEKQDSVHAELGKIPELSAAERKSLERGLTVKAEKRYRTMEGLHEGIYRERKQSFWKWAVGAGIVAVIVLCVFSIGTKDKRMEEAAVAGNYTEGNQDINEWTKGEEEFKEKTREVEEEVGKLEPMEVQEEQVEPESIRKLREYYNENYVGKEVKAYFLDMTSDGKDEMIVTEMTQVERKGNFGEVIDEFLLTVFQYEDDSVEIIYEAVSDSEFLQKTGSNYYLTIDKNEICLMMYQWDLDAWVQPCIEKISLANVNNSGIDVEEVLLEEFDEKYRHSVLIIDSLSNVTGWEVSTKPLDYHDIQDRKEEFEKALKIAENAGEAVLNYRSVYDEENRCIFAITGGVTISASYYYMDIISDPITVWAFHDTQIEKVEKIDMEFDGMPLGCTGGEVYQFGKVQHYFVETMGKMGGNVQHKFSYEDGSVHEVDHNKLFSRDENGNVRMKIVNEVVICNDGGYEGVTIGNVGESVYNHYMYTDNYIDIFYYEHQYVEYAAEKIEKNVLEQYTNYNDVIKTIEEKLRETGSIWTEEEVLGCTINEIKLDDIRKTSNNVYYLNYKINGLVEYIGSSSWRAYAVLEVEGGQLKCREVIFGEKKERSEFRLPAYYGEKQELISANKTDTELEEMIREYSGKSIVGSCYDDYDNDGRYELFACVYASQSDLRYNFGRDTSGCSVWFSDGDQTIWVADLAEGYYFLDASVLKIGEKLQFSLTRVKLDDFQSMDEILAVAGYATTNCVLNDKIPQVIIQDKNVRFYQKSDSGKIGCYDLRQSVDSIFYKDGAYYWESDAQPVF